MAVNIDTVYQRVLAFANKEQRGYITPQEFNLFADQAQNEIFDQYFYDLNQLSRVNRSSEEYANMTEYLKEKIDIFKRKSSAALGDNASKGISSYAYQIGTVWNEEGFVIEEVEREKLQNLYRSRLLRPSVNKPVYIRRGTIMYVHPTSDYVNKTIYYEYIKQPDKPNWTYVVVHQKPMFDPNNSSYADFELHHSEENELVYKILGYAGITLKKPDVIQSSNSLEIAKVQQEKQA